MSILFLAIIKNIKYISIIILLLICCLLSPLRAQEDTNNLYLLLKNRYESASVYKEFIPDSVFEDTSKLLDQLSNNPAFDKNTLLQIKTATQVELLDSYISNSEKHQELKELETKIKNEESKYQELQDINKKLQLELNNKE